MALEQWQIDDFRKARPDTGSEVLCHAPFKSIYFAMGGRLFTCCFNKIYNLGTYPEQSIKDIWFGRKADIFRDALRRDDLSLGCQICGHLIAARNFDGIPIKNFDYYGWDEQGYPTKIDFELSNTCNLECIMCRGELSSSIRQNRERKPPIPSPYDSEFIRQLDEFIPHLQNSHFLGGEPFLIPQYLDIWERMIELNPKISISVQTNGTVMNERIMRILDKMSFSIAVSIDSIEKDTYEQIRVNAKFERVMENIRQLKQYCVRKGKMLTISYCPMQQNWHQLPAVVEFCNDLNVEVFFNTVTLPVKCALNYLPAAGLEKIIAFLEKHDLPENTEIEKHNRKCLEGVKNQLKYWREQVERNERVLGATGKATGLSDFFDRVKHYIESLDDKSWDEKGKLFSDIEEKTDYMLRCAEDEGFLKEAEEYICALEPGIICDFGATAEKEVLYSLLKSYVGV